jgi:serine/threonine protein phosphatase PrpC
MSNETDDQEGDESLLLNKPNTKKELDHGQSFAFGGMQGWRKSNEDFHKHLVPIDQNSWKLWSYFSIFDGHNGLNFIFKNKFLIYSHLGIDTAKNASQLLDKHLIDGLNKIVKDPSNEIHSSEFDINQLTEVIKQTFLQLDKELPSIVKDQSGSVCVNIFIEQFIN